ncbi:MAG: DJ-1 family glyoxalase III [Opitutaceae bacterium]
MSQHALIILHPGFEEIETVVPIDLLSRANIKVTQAALGDNRSVEGRSGITLQATHALDDVADQLFDVVIIPGGPGIMQLRNHEVICNLLQRHYENGRLCACICAAPLLLKDAGLLHDSKYTAHFSTLHELPDAVPQATVADGQLLTSQGAGTATEFALALVQHLCDSETAHTIAESISWQHPLPNHSNA